MIKKYQYGGPGYFLPKNNLQQKFKGKLYNLSRRIMATANGVKDINYDTLPSGEPLEGVAQTTYLLPRHLQKEKFLEYGYKESPGDYGLVKKAVGNRKLPVYQKNPDVISRNELQVVGNPDYTVWFGNSTEALTHAGNYPSAIYHDDQGNLYQKSWDLNDYGGGTGAYTRYSPKEKMMADIGDIIGSPVVVTTGFRPIYTQKGPEDKQANLLDTGEWKPLDAIINSYLNQKGLHIDSYKENGNNIKFLSLPEVIIKGKKQNIKMRDSIKAANARKWKHKEGGIIKADEGTKFLSKQWFKNAGNNISSFLSSDAGKGLLDLGKSAFSGYTDYKNASNLLDSQIEQSKADLEQTYNNAIQEALQNKILRQQLLKNRWQQAYQNGETLDNYSPIVASNIGWKEYSNSIQNANQIKNQKQNALDEQSKQIKSNMTTQLAGNFISQGLDYLGKISNKNGAPSSTQPKLTTNTWKPNTSLSTPNLGTGVQGSIPDFSYMLNPNYKV